MKSNFIFIIILWIALVGLGSAATPIIYKEIRIPMIEAGATGLEALLVYPNDSQSHPVVLISHGSPRDASKRPLMSAISSLPTAMEFARRGFATAVVMRRGYGSSGGGFVEGVGQCESPDYLHSALESAKDLHAILAYLKSVPAFDTSKILAVGVSAGGFATVALTADHPPPGLVAAIIFAGGRGSKASDDVCSKDRLIQTFGILGKTSRIPMLWVYAQNDHFFNPVLAKQFYAAFSKNGGNATLMIIPNYGTEGHFLFSNDGIPVWTIILDNFLKKQNLVLYKNLLPLPDTSQMAIPKKLSSNGKKDFSKYIKAGPHKAFAMAPDGAYGWRTEQRTTDEAKQQALDYCQQHTHKQCNIVAVDNEMI